MKTYTLKDKPKLKRKLDLLVSARIRERDKGKPCIDLCGKQGTKQAGHFRRRECMQTRWHPWNVNGQNEYCNNWDNDTFRHAKGIDKKWGHGMADYLEHESRRIKNWTIPELLQLIEACKTYEAYEKKYFELQ